MSHFTVMVRLPGSVGSDDVEDAVGRVLLPYKESLGDDDPDELRRYFVFEDEEDEYRKQYETGTRRMIRTPEGETLDPYDERFRRKGSFGGLSFGPNPEDNSHVIPPGCREVQVPFKDVYSTFDAFVENYHGQDERDPQKNRFGHWHNPQAKWDWWSIGGRWSGKLLLKTGRTSALPLGREGAFGTDARTKAEIKTGRKADVCRIEDLDFDLAAIETKKRALAFLTEWEAFVAGREFPPFDGPREEALSLGLVSCMDEDKLTPKHRDSAKFKLVKWDRQLKKGVDRFDVIRLGLTQERLLADLLPSFDVLSTFAKIDARPDVPKDQQGWHAPGRMGWWAATDASPDTWAAFKGNFTEWLKGGDQRDWVVVVDCHI